MTNPNWWDVEPFAKQNYCVAQYDCDCKGLDYDLPLIIAEVEKRGKTTLSREKDSGDYYVKDLFSCDKCAGIHWVTETREENRYSFCPHCGAKIAWDK